MFLRRTVQAARRFSMSPTYRSSYVAAPRKTLTDLRSQYEAKAPISVVTAWDFLTGQIVEKSQADVALVGDSLAMVALGYPDTNEIELEEMLYHIRAVNRGNASSFIVADMPFGTYETSTKQAVETAIKIVKHGKAQAVKLEGGQEMADTIKSIVTAGVPVMGHIGLTPQKHHTLGGYKLQGNSVEGARKLIDDALALQEAGAFSMILECIPSKLAEVVTQTVKIPTVGIGAGPHVSGQVLVLADMLQMNDPEKYKLAKFVKLYMSFFENATEAVSQYRADVSEGVFPNADEHGYKIKKDILKAARAYAETKKEE